MTSLRRAIPVVLIVLFGLLFFTRLLLQPGSVLYSDYSDFIIYHLPCHYFLVRSWQATGELPLWCSEMFAGMPFVQDPQVTAFYPPHLPLYWLAESRQGWALSGLIVLHVIAGGLCMYAYARHQELGPPAALVAALGFMFAGKWLQHLLVAGHYNLVALAWLPLVLLLMEKAIRRRSVLHATLAGGVFALIVLGTHPQVTIYSGLFIALWTLGAALGPEPGRAEGARTPRLLASWLAVGIWTALVAGLLAGVQLLPALEAARQSSRTLGVPLSGETLGGSIRSILGLVGPPISTDSSWFWEDRVSLGLLWLAAALCAPLVVPTRQVRLWAGLGLLWLLLGLIGIALLQWLPPFHLWRMQSRMLLLAAFPVALLAGTTTQALFADIGLSAAERARCRGILLRTAAFVLLPLGAYALMLHLRGYRLLPAPYWFALLVTVPAAWWLLGRARTGTTLLLWIGVLLADLWTLALPLVDVYPEDRLFAAPGCVRYLANRAAERGRVLDFSPAPFEEIPACRTPLWLNFPMVLGIEPVRGYNPLDVLRYKQFLLYIHNQDQPLRAVDRPGPGGVIIHNQALADLLGIRFLLLASNVPLAAIVPDAEARKHWSEAYRDVDPWAYSFVPSGPNHLDAGFQSLPPYIVYENSRALPRAFVVHEAAALPEQPLAVLKTTDFRRRVLLEDWDASAAHRGTASSAASTARILDYRPNRVTLAVKTDSPGWLVLTDLWYPGWTCTVNGAPVTVQRANYAFRAVAIPAGAHEVVFTLAPASYEYGKWLSWITVIVVSGGVLLLLGRRVLTRKRH